MATGIAVTTGHGVAAEIAATKVMCEAFDAACKARGDIGRAGVAYEIVARRITALPFGVNATDGFRAGVADVRCCSRAIVQDLSAK
jgi:hypothetical protein